MVRLSVTTLLAVALAAGSAVAFSHEYERRSDLDSNLYEREFVDDQEVLVSRQDLEDLYGRWDFDDLKWEFRKLEHKAKSLVSRREFFDDLEAREPGFMKGSTNTHSLARGLRAAGATAAAVASDKYNTRELHEELSERDLDAEELFGREYDLLDERDITDDLD